MERVYPCERQYGASDWYNRVVPERCSPRMEDRRKRDLLEQVQVWCIASVMGTKMSHLPTPRVLRAPGQRAQQRRVSCDLMGVLLAALALRLTRGPGGHAVRVDRAGA